MHQEFLDTLLVPPEVPLVPQVFLVLRAPQVPLAETDLGHLTWASTSVTTSRVTTSGSSCPVLRVPLVHRGPQVASL